MRIIRLLGDGGKPLLANDLGTGQAERLTGSLFDPADPVRPTGQVMPLPSRRLAPLEPANIFCIGKNYLDHAKEFDSDPPDQPLIFMKPTTALNHPGSPICIPKCQMDGPETDYEAELAVVIGPKPARDVAEAEALDYVLGYTCAIDVSARRWQKQGGGGQWVRGKGFDTFCPLGPALVTGDEIPDPQTLDIRLTLNGQVMQQANTADMIFTVAHLVAFISQDTTLAPGTIILTGTPAGVGAARTPPVWLKGGDQVTVEIERIGVLSNPVVE